MNKNRKVNFIFRESKQAESFESNSAGNMFVNKGTTIAKVNNMPLAPGEFMVLDVNVYEEDISPYEFAFDNSNGGTINSLWIVQKFYTNG